MYKETILSKALSLPLTKENLDTYFDNYFVKCGKSGREREGEKYYLVIEFNNPKESEDAVYIKKVNRNEDGSGFINLEITQPTQITIKQFFEICNHEGLSDPERSPNRLFDGTGSILKKTKYDVIEKNTIDGKLVLPSNRLGEKIS